MIKTMVRVTYVAMESEGIRPLVTASTMKELRMALDEQYSFAECMGFTPYFTKYPDEYEGYYTYKLAKGIMDKVKVYCTEYYPHTVYEVKDYEI